MHYFDSLYTPFGPQFMPALLPFIAVIAVWTIIIKGYALWHAARNSQKWWFIALLVINTVGILEIIYLVWFRPSSHTSTPAVSSSTQA
jgi:methionyl-tRNA synthetase